MVVLFKGHTTNETPDSVEARSMAAPVLRTGYTSLSVVLGREAMSFVSYTLPSYILESRTNRTPLATTRCDLPGTRTYQVETQGGQPAPSRFHESSTTTANH